MKLFRTRPEYPKDRDLARVVRSAASRLVDKIGRLDVRPLDLSEDTRDLLENRREKLCSRIERDAQVFAWSLPRNEKPFTDLKVVAFNDGIGVFSLLARECSIGTVVYHDSSDVLRCDARTIARSIGAPADHYIFGDAEEVEFVLKRYSIVCDAFVSCDVSFSPHARCAPYTLTSLLNEISEESMGAISLALAIEERSSCRSPVRRPQDDFSKELVRAGFELKIVRAHDRSNRLLILTGSRSAGTLPLDAAPTGAGAHRTPVRIPPNAHEPVRVPTR